MPGLHTGSKIADLVDSVPSEYNLQSKVEFIVTDNALDMKKAFTLLSSFHSHDRNDDDMDIPADDSELVDDDTMWEDLDDHEADSILHDQGNEDSNDVRTLEKNPCFGHTLQLVVKDDVDSWVQKHAQLFQSVASFQVYSIRARRKAIWRQSVNSANEWHTLDGVACTIS